MIKYLKMKKKEVKLKLTFYTMLEYIINEKSDKEFNNLSYI